MSTRFPKHEGIGRGSNVRLKNINYTEQLQDMVVNVKQKVMTGKRSATRGSFSSMSAVRCMSGNAQG